MAFAFVRLARRKRGWFRRNPEQRELSARLARLARRMLGEVAHAVKHGVELELHPAAAPAKLSVNHRADIELAVDTSVVGPALVAHASELVAGLFDELDVEWAEPFELAVVQRATCEHVAGVLRGGARKVGVDREFHVDAAVLTPLGPRDAAWRDAVLADPLRARDAFAWWELAPGHEARSRALLAMWHDVPWRAPLDNDERAVMKRVDKDLRAAHREDRELELPWPEWAQIHDFLCTPDEIVDEVVRRAGGREPAIGYRRHDLDVELSGGWVIRMPGSFVGSWEDDGGRYWATDGERTLEFSSVTAHDETDSARLLAVADERHPVVERIADGDRLGRAEVYDDGDVRVVHGLVARAPHVAILTCKGAPSDQDWALATWRSLRIAG